MLGLTLMNILNWLHLTPEVILLNCTNVQ